MRHRITLCSTNINQMCCATVTLQHLTHWQWDQSAKILIDISVWTSNGGTDNNNNNYQHYSNIDRQMSVNLKSAHFPQIMQWENCKSGAKIGAQLANKWWSFAVNLPTFMWTANASENLLICMWIHTHTHMDWNTSKSTKTNTSA